MRPYEVTDEVQNNLNEINRRRAKLRHKALMREKVIVNSLIVVGLLVVILGFGSMLWYIWGLG